MSSFRWRKIIACLFAAGSSLASIAAQTRPVEKNHSLSGEIFDALSGRPVTDVELALSTAHWETAADPVMPDSQGRFVFHGLAPGEIQTIRIGREDKEKVVAFRLLPRGSVAGVIRDEFGEVIVGASVTLSRPQWSDGTVVLQQSNQATTDDRGQYRIHNVVHRKLRPRSWPESQSGTR
jgi:hypothetical protein